MSSKRLNVLVGCERSGIVREAFRHEGHEAISCDLEPSQQMGPHIQGDILKEIEKNASMYDLMIVFPPCTHICVSGAAWFKDKIKEQKEALEFVRKLMDAPIPKICVENPVGVISTKIRKPDQIIQPFQFGHPVKKTTCLWLKNLPKLIPTEIVQPEITTLKTGAKFSTWDYKISMNHKERAWLRSITFPGVAMAMATQWGGHIE